MKWVGYISLFLILWHFLFYPILLILLSFIKKRPLIEEDGKEPNSPTVSLIIAAHNEDKVIEKKILNALSLDYPKDKLEIIVASDCSTDKTNEIVNKYRKTNENLKLLKIEKRGGKLNAYNTAVKLAKGEVLAFSDANTMWNKESLKELVNSLNRERISCVCGHLIYTNNDESPVAYSESRYWKIENLIKKAESSFYSLTALNGGIYAVKKSDYIFIDPLYSHDLCLPILLAKEKKRTIFNGKAVASEKAATTSKEETKRKIRMFGRVYSFMFRNFNLFINPFIYNFNFFVSIISHRTIRYLLPFLHILLFIASSVLFSYNLFFKTILLLHIIYMALVAFSFAIKHRFKPFYFLYYYLLFLATMLIGFYQFLTGKIKPYWDSAETTRR